jgi:hypothetical protein
MPGEVAPNEIGGALSARIGGRGPPRLAAALSAPQARLAHQPHDPIAPGALTSPPQRSVHPPLAVALIVRAVDLSDPAGEPLVLDPAR